MANVAFITAYEKSADTEEKEQYKKLKILATKCKELGLSVSVGRNGGAENAVYEVYKNVPYLLEECLPWEGFGIKSNQKKMGNFEEIILRGEKFNRAVEIAIQAINTEDGMEKNAFRPEKESTKKFYARSVAQVRGRDLTIGSFASITIFDGKEKSSGGVNEKLRVVYRVAMEIENTEVWNMRDEKQFTSLCTLLDRQIKYNEAKREKEKLSNKKPVVEGLVKYNPKAITQEKALELIKSSAWVQKNHLRVREDENTVGVREFAEGIERLNEKNFMSEIANMSNDEKKKIKLSLEECYGPETRKLVENKINKDIIAFKKEKSTPTPSLGR